MWSLYVWWFGSNHSWLPIFWSVQHTRHVSIPLRRDTRISNIYTSGEAKISHAWYRNGILGRSNIVFKNSTRVRICNSNKISKNLLYWLMVRWIVKRMGPKVHLSSNYREFWNTLGQIYRCKIQLKWQRRRTMGHILSDKIWELKLLWVLTQ